MNARRKPELTYDSQKIAGVTVILVWQYGTLIFWSRVHGRTGMNPTQFLKPQKIFQSYPEIRWAALIGEKGQVPFSVMRPGAESLVPENEITGFMEANRAKSILKASEGLGQWAGKVEGALIRYEKVFLYVIQLQTDVLALSIDRSTPFERIAQIAKGVLSDLQLQQ